MGLIVQKYGGTSLSDPDRIRRCAARAVAAHLEGHAVLVVTSAMGRTTDQLLDLAGRITTTPPRRELDLLLATGEQVSAALMAMAIHELGVEAVSLPAHGLGLITDLVHCNAKIHRIEADALRRQLAASRIVVATGFQGVSAEGQITTLGRGGSDTTAVAIAAALGVRHGTGVCEIYTDVDGVYTADPRIVPDARRLSRLSYGEMVELAALGAGVLHGRAVLFAQRYQVPMHVRHSARDEEGTMIVRETPEMERVCVVGCALTPDLARLTVRGLHNTPGIQSSIFRAVSEAGTVVDDIIQIENGDAADVCFTVEAPRLADLRVAVQGALETIGCGALSIEVGLAKISAVGVGMRTHTDVAATMFDALGKAGINIANITTSEIKISCFVPREDGRRALRAVHDAFNLSEHPNAAGRGTNAAQPRCAGAGAGGA
ncbi:MAG: aspartate kinase [Planctomycetota bacterium]|nr:aspartate kinase [Planctomycetota bacterium]